MKSYEDLNKLTFRTNSFNLIVSNLAQELKITYVRKYISPGVFHHLMLFFTLDWPQLDIKVVPINMPITNVSSFL